MPQVRCICKRILSYRAEHAGKIVQCPACSARVRLPAAPAVGSADSSAGGQSPEPAPSAPWPPAAVEQVGEKAALEGGLQLEDDLPTTRSAAWRAAEAARKGESSPPAPAPAAPTAPRTESAQAAPAGMVPPTPSVKAEGPTLPKGEAETAAEPAPSGSSFRQEFRGAFKYPLSIDGIAVLIFSAIMMIVGHYIVYAASFVPILGQLVLAVVYGVLAVYFTGYAMSVVESSARGDGQPPDLPQMGEAFTSPLVPVATLGVITVGPCLIFTLWVTDAYPWISWALLLPGLSYLPMGILCATLDNSIKGFNPMRGIRAIGKVRREYAVIWGMLMFVTALQAVGGWAIHSYVRNFCMGVASRRVATFDKVADCSRLNPTSGKNGT